MAGSSGIGSMPGTDYAESARIALGEVSIPFVPELPARGPHAAMVGRTVGLISELGADLQPDGWRVGVGEGVDQRRAKSLIRQDLDLAEELAHDYDGSFKLQVVGPLTLAAAVELPRGEKVLGDHGARRELAEALGLAVEGHITDVQRRLPLADLIVQIDEPSLRAVLDGRIRTASGYRTYRTVDAPEADAVLRPLVDVIVQAGARPAVHSCANGFPVALLRGAGFQILSFDLSYAGADDIWAEAFDAGVDLWPGAIPAIGRVSAGQTVERVERFFGTLGYPPESFAERLVVTPTCGLAGTDPSGARLALATATQVAGEF